MTASLSVLIKEERERCMTLTKMLVRGPGKDFLLYCIDQSIYPDQVEEFRRRFEETPAEVEDLM